MPCSSNHRPIITQGFSVGRYAGSIILFAPTRGCLADGSLPRLGVGRSPKTEPRATGYRPLPGAFQLGSRLHRSQDTPQRGVSRAELLSPTGRKIHSRRYSRAAAKPPECKKQRGTPLKTAVTACLGVGLAEDGPASA